MAGMVAASSSGDGDAASSPPGIQASAHQPGRRPMTDGGLSPETRAWPSGAGSRLNEPVREDRPEDVQTRVDALTTPAAEGRAVEPDPWLRRYYPDEVAALEEAARAETAERIAAAIEAARDGGRRIEPYSNHYNAGVAEAARIAREAR